MVIIVTRKNMKTSLKMDDFVGLSQEEERPFSAWYTCGKYSCQGQCRLPEERAGWRVYAKGWLRRSVTQSHALGLCWGEGEGTHW